MSNGNNSAPLTRDQMLARRSGSPAKCWLEDGSFVLIRKPTGEQYREWRRLLRDDKGELLPERFDLDEEIMLSLLIVDADGNLQFTVEDVMDKRCFDTFPMNDLARMKRMVSELMGNNITDEWRGKN